MALEFISDLRVVSLLLSDPIMTDEGEPVPDDPQETPETDNESVKTFDNLQVSQASPDQQQVSTPPQGDQSGVGRDSCDDEASKEGVKGDSISRMESKIKNSIIASKNRLADLYYGNVRKDGRYGH